MFDQDPDRNVGFLLHDVSRLLRKRFDRRARALGLTRAQWRVLVHLAPRQGINQTALADILELDNVTLGRHVDRLEQTGWLERRPADFGRKLTFVNVTDVASDPAASKWASSRVIFTLRAPERPGNYPLVGVYFYGTEKATALGSVTHPVYGKQPLGGYGGKSGRVAFSQSLLITVK